MNTYLAEYKRKLLTAEAAANLVQSNNIVDYGMFATKPVDFDAALSKRVGQVQNVAIRGTGTVPPFPQVLFGVTVIFPEEALASKSTVIALVPAPVAMVAPAGNDQT